MRLHTLVGVNMMMMMMMMMMMCVCVCVYVCLCVLGNGIKWKYHLSGGKMTMGVQVALQDGNILRYSHLSHSPIFPEWVGKNSFLKPISLILQIYIFLKRLKWDFLIQGKLN